MAENAARRGEGEEPTEDGFRGAALGLLDSLYGDILGEDEFAQRFGELDDSALREEIGEVLTRLQDSAPTEHGVEFLLEKFGLEPEGDGNAKSSAEIAMGHGEPKTTVEAYADSVLEQLRAFIAQELADEPLSDPPEVVELPIEDEELDPVDIEIQRAHEVLAARRQTVLAAQRKTRITDRIARRKRDSSSDVPEDVITHPDPTDIIGVYTREIRRVPRLNSAEERSLGRLVQLGQTAQEQIEAEGLDLEETARLQVLVDAGLEAKQFFLEANLRLVVSIAAKYKPVSKLDFEDLIQEGNIGLNRAVETFDPGLGFTFGNYATLKIKGAISRAIVNSGRTVRFPVHIEDKLSKMRSATYRFVQEYGREPSDEELAGKVEMRVEEMDELRERVRTLRNPKSLNRRVGEDQDAEEGDLIGDETAEKPEDEALRGLMAEWLHKLADVLSEREWYVLRLRFGIGERIHKFEEVGAAIGASRQTALRVERAAIAKLKDAVERYRAKNPSQDPE